MVQTLDRRVSDKKVNELEEKIDNFKDDVDSMKNGCFQHKLEISNKFENIERAFQEGGMIHNMNQKLNEIDHRLFRTNGNRALVDEIRDINNTLVKQDNALKTHLSTHNDSKLVKKQYAYLLLSILLASTIGTAATSLTVKLLTKQIQPTSIVQNNQ